MNLFRKNKLIIIILPLLSAAIIIYLHFTFHFHEKYEAIALVWIPGYSEESPTLFNDFKEMLNSKELTDLLRVDLQAGDSNQRKLDDASIRKLIIFKTNETNKIVSIGFPSENPVIASNALKIIYNYLDLKVEKLFAINSFVILNNKEFIAKPVSIYKLALVIAGSTFVVLVIGLLLMDCLRTEGYPKNDLLDRS